MDINFKSIYNKFGIQLTLLKGMVGKKQKMKQVIQGGRVVQLTWAKYINSDIFLRKQWKQKKTKKRNHFFNLI